VEAKNIQLFPHPCLELSNFTRKSTNLTVIICCSKKLFPFPKYTGIAWTLNPYPRPLFWSFITGRGVPGIGEKGRPGDESRELGFDKIDDGGG